MVLMVLLPRFTVLRSMMVEEDDAIDEEDEVVGCGIRESGIGIEDKAPLFENSVSSLFL